MKRQKNLLILVGVLAALCAGIATVKGSGMSELCETLVTGWLADGTIDALIAENGIA